MGISQQEQLKHEKSEARKNRLLEMYKLHAQLVSDTNNLKAATNRFYPTVMSGLVLIFFTFLQRKDIIFSKEIDEKIIIEISIAAVGYLGMVLSLV